jgi:carboxylate-amine ligase
MAGEAEAQGLLTLGVEEEYLLVDAVEPRAVEAVEEVFDRLDEDILDSVQHEYVRSQIETASPPQLELRDLFESLTRLRAGLAAAAERAGVRLVAVGANPGPGPHSQVVDSPRYHRMRERFGDLSPGPGMCGTHVHVSVPDDETGVQILDFEGGYAVLDVDSEQTAQRVLREAVARGDVGSFAPQHPSLAQIFREVIR